MIILQCDVEECIRRVLKRSATSGRVDDTEETAHSALAHFEKQSAPLIKEFAAKGLLQTVDCDRSIADAYSQLLPHVLAVIAPLIADSQSGAFLQPTTVDATSVEDVPAEYADAT